MAQQMDEIRSAGIDEIVVSWWGQGSAEDLLLPAVIVAARADGIAVAVHLEPYGGRTVSSTVADVAYLRNYGITSFYVYRPFDMAVGDWAAAKSALHAGGVNLFAQTGLVGSCGTGRLRRRVHLRHRHLRRRQVPSPLCRGARASPRLRAVGGARLRRPPRQ